MYSACVKRRFAARESCQRVLRTLFTREEEVNSAVRNEPKCIPQAGTDIQCQQAELAQELDGGQ